MKSRDARTALVYSTDSGRTCPACRQALAACQCPGPASGLLGDGSVRVSRETAGRGGKGVTVVKGLALDAVAAATLAKRLKAACATGGTVKDNLLELQGDHVDRVVALLRAEGWSVKRAGG